MEIVKAALIHLAVPAAGLAVYLRLRRRMRESGVQNPPDVALFILFMTYGGWLMIVLTALFWYASGMLLLGLVYLMFVAPVVMIVMAVRLYPQRKVSRYHRGSFLASAAYIIFPVGVVVLRFVLVLFYGK